MAGRNSYLSWIVFFGGLWLIAAPFVLGYSTVAAAATNDFTLGVIIAVLAFINAVWGRATASWLAFFVVLAGLWMIASPFILGYTQVNAAVANDIILGIGIVFFSGLRAFSVRETPLAGYGSAYYSEERPKKEERTEMEDEEKNE